jgi:hypothetical protein
MPNEIISYLEMCQREGVSLQRGMNYRIRGDYSVILMSLRPNAPYQDKLEGDGTILIYEGHDSPHTISIPNPKNNNQPQFTHSGTLTENGKFHLAAQEYKQGLRDPEKVKVYEKIHSGIWSYNGLFHLIDSWKESDGSREVFKFKLAVVNDFKQKTDQSSSPQNEEG